MYDIMENGTANLLSINLSPEVGDGPRNVYPSDDGKWLYVVSSSKQLSRGPKTTLTDGNQINEHCMSRCN